MPSIRDSYRALASRGRLSVCLAALVALVAASPTRSQARPAGEPRPASTATTVMYRTVKIDGLDIF